MTDEEIDRQIKPIGAGIEALNAKFDALIAELKRNPAGLAESEKRAEEAERIAERTRIDNAYRRIVPEKYGDMPDIIDRTKNAAYVTKCIAAWQNMKNRQPTTLLMLGPSGIGKTYLACWMIRQSLSAYKGVIKTTFGETVSESPAYWSACYVTGEKLAQRYKQAESFSATTTKERIAWEYMQYDLLVIDEIGRRQSPQEQDALFDIIDGRCADMVLISNLSLQAFQEYIGAAVVDRIRPTVVCPSAEGTISWRTK
jgi:DNA replication protein DnaC